MDFKWRHRSFVCPLCIYINGWTGISSLGTNLARFAVGMPAFPYVRVCSLTAATLVKCAALGVGGKPYGVG
jgi:hypothetical protein